MHIIEYPLFIRMISSEKRLHQTGYPIKYIIKEGMSKALRQQRYQLRRFSTSSLEMDAAVFFTCTLSEPKR